MQTVIIKYSNQIQIICTLLNGINYSYLALIIIFNNNNLFSHIYMVLSISLVLVISKKTHRSRCNRYILSVSE